MKEGWERKKLKEVGKAQTGTTPPTGDKDNYGSYIPFVKPADFNPNGEIELGNSMLSKKGLENGRYFAANSVLMVCIGATIGKTGYTDTAVSSNQQINVLTPFEAVDYKFLYYWMISPFIQNAVLKIGKSSQATLPIINKSKWENLEVFVPPLAEQKQIVVILDEAFEAIDQAKANIERNIENAKELFQSKLNDIFSNRGEELMLVELSEISNVKDGTHDSPKYVDEHLGIPFVTQKNILETGISFDDTKFITPEDHSKFYKRSNVAYNDIIFSMIGANRGMACIVDDKRIFSIKNVGLIKSSQKYRPKYLLFYLKSPIAQSYVANNSSGSAQGFIGLTKLRAFPIPLVNLEKQMSIENQLDILDNSLKKLEIYFKNRLENLEELKKSILQKAFAGELTSPAGTR